VHRAMADDATAQDHGALDPHEREDPIHQRHGSRLGPGDQEDAAVR
jgi:hypothetical protein